jgi:hypothetical protein
MRRRWSQFLTAGLHVLLVAGCDTVTEPRTPPIQERFIFQNDLQGWSGRAIDVHVGDDEIDWSIEHSTERATVGSGSVRLSVDNRSDAAKLWIEYSVMVAPNADYDVRIDFSLATSDWSDVNLWRVLAGALPESPAITDDLVPAFQNDTRAGTPPGSGYVWQRRTYNEALRTGSEGMIYVIVGIWGTSEFQRTYFVDDVVLTIRRL